MHQDKPSRESSMKLSHVVVLSIIGMLTTSLSVLVFTSPRQISQDALTSNEMETTPYEVPLSTIPKQTLTVEPPLAVTSTIPNPNEPPQLKRAKQQATAPETAELLLFAPNEPCTFYVDGKYVQGSEAVSLFASLGEHVVRCERPNGRSVVQRVSVGSEARNPYFF